MWERYRIVFIVILSETRGFVWFFFNNVLNLVLPVLAFFFVLRCLNIDYATTFQRYSFIYKGLFYLMFIVSVPIKVSDWVKTQRYRNSLEQVDMTQHGFWGVIRDIFIVYYLSFFLLELPILIFVSKYFLNINLISFINFPLVLLFAISLLLSYSIMKIAVSFFLMFNRVIFDFDENHRFLNFFSGVYAPIFVFPFFVQIVGLAFPFAHGVILMHKIVSQRYPITSLLWELLFFLLYVTLIFFLSKRWSQKLYLYVLKNKGLCYQ